MSRWLFSLLILPLTFAYSQTHSAQPRRAASLAEQKMCYEQAQRLRNADTMMLVNHYDKARNVCFVRTWESLHDPNDQNKLIGSSFELRDAFEGFSYGECISNTDDKVLDCWASEPKQGKRTFSSTDDWMQFVGQTYMSD